MDKVLQEVIKRFASIKQRLLLIEKIWGKKEDKYDAERDLYKFENAANNFLAWYEVKKVIEKEIKIKGMIDLKKKMDYLTRHLRHASYFACLSSERIFMGENRNYTFRPYCYWNDLSYMGGDFFYFGGRTPLGMIPSIGEKWDLKKEKTKWILSSEENKYDLSLIYNNSHIDKEKFIKILESIYLVNEKINSSKIKMDYNGAEILINESTSFSFGNERLSFLSSGGDAHFDIDLINKKFPAEKLFEDIKAKKSMSEIEKGLKDFMVEDLIDEFYSSSDNDFMEDLKRFLDFFNKFLPSVKKGIKSIESVAKIVKEETDKFSCYTENATTYLKLLKK